MEDDVKKAISAWLISRFYESWWTPNFKRMAQKMIEHCKIQTIEDLNRSIDAGELEEVIDLHLEKMTEIVRSRKRIVHLSEVDD
ncbi:MAG: hypothetical protein ACI9T9_001281 [Oleiphilaceae bacterium]|jgi:hypothetical protein